MGTHQKDLAHTQFLELLHELAVEYAKTQEDVHALEGGLKKLLEHAKARNIGNTHVQTQAALVLRNLATAHNELRHAFERLTKV